MPDFRLTLAQYTYLLNICLPHSIKYLQANNLCYRYNYVKYFRFPIYTNITSEFYRVFTAKPGHRSIQACWARWLCRSLLGPFWLSSMLFYFYILNIYGYNLIKKFSVNTSTDHVLPSTCFHHWNYHYLHPPYLILVCSLWNMPPSSSGRFWSTSSIKYKLY